MVLQQLLPVFNEGFHSLHEFVGDLTDIRKVFEELLDLLDADSSLLHFEEHVDGDCLAVVSGYLDS